jgi:tRNA-2-methylthio-N6-dimethylallyladenosine synthase
MLRAMKRNYTVEEYRDMLRRTRETVPNAAVTSDFIVGFCGETDADFQATIDLVRESRFKNSFIFKYSARPGTKADELLADDVPDAVKRERNNELLAIQTEISEQDQQPFIGQTLDVLIEGPSKLGQRQAEGPVRQLTGRTMCDRIVVFEGSERLIGRIMPVLIYDATAFTLFGSVVTHHAGPEVYSLQVLPL